MANTTSSSGCSSSSTSAHKTLPGTSSACSSQSITTTHDFVVNNFSLLDGMGSGRCVTSGTFTVGDTAWDISLYPDGIQDYFISHYLYPDGMETARHVSVSLSFRRGPNNTKAKFSCSLLLDKDNATVLKECKHHTFPAPSYWWTWPEFVSKSELQEMLKGSSSSDSFTIRCVLTVLTTRTEDAEAIVVPPSDLHRDLARMLADGDGADVTIAVGDRSFLAHRYVLAARSKVFKAQLLGDDMKAESLLKIEDMEPSVFEMLLHFIYTDSLPAEKFEGDDKCVATMDLLVAADRYGLLRLGLMCEEKLRGWIDAHSVMTILRLADQHHREQLKEACMRFIACPDVLRDVMETEEFDDIFTNYPTIIWEILETIAWPQTEDSGQDCLREDWIYLHPEMME